MRTKCLIIDDEPLAIEIIESYLQKVEGFEVVAKFNNPLDAFDFLQKKSIDLMFLDIQMPKLSGIEFVKTLKKVPKIIFTTAYRDYAVEGFELDVLDYLIKPISFERFLKAINKYYQAGSMPAQLLVNNPEHPNVAEDPHFYVKENKKMVKIYLKDILYIESIKDYVKIYAINKAVVTKQQISFFEEILPTEQFLRIHRSFIVSVSKIEAFSSSTVEVGKKELPIGRSYKNMVLNTLNTKSDSL